MRDSAEVGYRLSVNSTLKMLQRDLKPLGRNLAETDDIKNIMEVHDAINHAINKAADSLKAIGKGSAT